MTPFYRLLMRLINALLLQRAEMQEQLVATQHQLIEAQRELNRVRKQLEKMTPKNPKDADVIWHIHAGIFSQEAASSTDLDTVLRYQDWLTNVLGKKYIKPYVNAKVYMECLNQMTRGLPQRIAELQTRRDLTTPPVPEIGASYGRAALKVMRSGR